MPYAQTDRPLHITTSLGEDKFLLVSLSGSEYISGLFQFELKVVWQGASPVVFKNILGQKVTVEIDFHETKRYINGIVKSIAQGSKDSSKDLTWYTLTVVPTMWLMTRKVNCRIFQKMDATQIIQKVVKEAGITDLKLQLQGTYLQRDYCVQYYETDFAFVSRLMEFEGIYYFFEHEDGKHTLVLSDDKSGFQELPGGPEVEYEEVVGGLRTAGRIYEWERAQEMNSGKFTSVDYNFEKPTVSLLATTETKLGLSGSTALEVYENPGSQQVKSDGDKFVKTRVEEEEARTQTVYGRSFNIGFCPGFKFTLKNHFADSGLFTITGVTHSASQPLDTGSDAEGFVYENQFTCLTFDSQYRPPRVTPLPTTRGVQTAVVVGPGGEEIYTDQYGRVKVQFFWDREGQKNESSSCWIRVATYWAGKAWGAIHIPRIGQEVVVDFVEGDVDRPLIIGSVYNAVQATPYSLPGEATKSTLKSNSSKGGGGFNELRFEDKKGSEEIYFQAEKDHNTLIKHDETRDVKHDRTTKIEHDETQTVTNNETITVDQGNQTITLNQGNQSTTLKQGNQSTEVKMGNQSIKLGMGNQNTKLDLGAATTEAMQSITLKVGQSSIVVDQMGVTIKGMMIQVQGQVMVQVKAPIVQVNADGVAILKGGIVLIN